jgi:hypothetical protein
MVTRSLACAALLAALPLSGGLAEPLTGSDIRARSTGGEFRGYGPSRNSNLEDYIWRLRADGSLSSVSSYRRRYGTNTGGFEENSDSGTWRVDDNRLCVEFRAAHSALSGCYAVDGVGGDHVRLSGPARLEGTLSR